MLCRNGFRDVWLNPSQYDYRSFFNLIISFCNIDFIQGRYDYELFYYLYPQLEYPPHHLE